MKNLDELIAKQNEYDSESRDFINSLKFANNELADISAMKQSEGWKLIDKKIREELQIQILNLVKDDMKINTLLALLKVADTKSLSKILEDEVAKLIPE